MSGSRLHSIHECRVRLGHIGRDAVYELLNLGQLEAKKIGRRTFVTDKSLENYIQNLPPFPRRSSAYKPKREDFIRSKVTLGASDCSSRAKRKRPTSVLVDAGHQRIKSARG